MMSNVKLLLFSLAISICGQVEGNAIEPDCITPDNSAGMCVRVNFCVSIMTALINNDHRTNPVVAQFLRESQCGIRSNSHDVCCSLNSIDFGDEPVNAVARHHVEFTTEKSSIDTRSCGELADSETPLKWIAELWFNRDTFGRVQLESRCLGTLISLKHVTVPAHCVASLPANVSIAHVGLHNHEYKVSRIFIHANYNQPKFANDIAIIELDPDSADSGRINNAICLEMSTTNAPKSTLAIMKNARSSHKYDKIEFINDNNCSTFLTQQFTALTAGQFCANIQTNETEYSPFIGAVVLQSNNNRQYTLKAFTSTAIRREQSLDESRSYVFSDVEHHLGWIRNVIGDITPLTTTEPTSYLSDEFRDCPLTNSNSKGRCVSEEDCTIFHEAPRPLSREQEATLEQMKCINDAEDYEESDGICCPLKYINQSKPKASSIEIDEKYRFRRGAKLLDLQRCGRQTTSTRIIGGEKANFKEFPWYGLIKYRYGRIEKFTCGSTLISARYVLTCAHCISNLPHGYRVTAVRLGEYDLRTNPDCDTDADDCNPPVQDIQIEKLIPHEKYNNPLYANDIGLVKLAREPDMTQGIVPICLPINSAMQGPFEHKYIVTGFGLTEHGRESDVMLKIFVPKVKKETCQSFHRSLITLSEGHECYGGEGVIDSCKGDSGGPAMNVVVSSDGILRIVQLGIVAAGHSECGRGASDYPGIYSDVKHFMEWILDNMEGESSSSW